MRSDSATGGLSVFAGRPDERLNLLLQGKDVRSSAPTVVTGWASCLATKGWVRRWRRLSCGSRSRNGLSVSQVITRFTAHQGRFTMGKKLPPINVSDDAKLALRNVSNEGNPASNVTVEAIGFDGIKRSLTRNLVNQPVYEAIVVKAQEPMTLRTFDQRPQLTQQMRIHTLQSLNIYFRFVSEFRLLHRLRVLQGFAVFVHLCRQSVMFSPRTCLFTSGCNVL